MTFEILSSFVSALCVAIGLFAVFLRRKAILSWLFFVGMTLLAAERFTEQCALRQSETIAAMHGIESAMWFHTIAIGPWLAFCIMYGRGNAGEFIRRRLWFLIAAVLIPIALMAPSIQPFQHFQPLLSIADEGAGDQIQFLGSGKTWIVSMITFTLLPIVYLERTFRASFGINRWRIKYMILGLTVIFSVKVYSLVEMFLYSFYQPSVYPLSTFGIFFGCGFITICYFRSGFNRIELYPSTSVINGSLTLMIAGIYFLIVGVLAQAFRMIVGMIDFPAQTIVVLIGFVGITVILVSDRFRVGLNHYVRTNFQRQEHDSRMIWKEFTLSISSMLDDTSLSIKASEVISRNFHVLGVSVFRLGIDSPSLDCLHTTENQGTSSRINLSTRELSNIQAIGSPFNLEKQKTSWGDTIRQSSPSKFNHGGDRLAIPLVASDKLVGLVILGDRVCGNPYTHEDIDLFGCIGDQLAAAFLNRQLNEKVVGSTQLDAFQTISTFFVHDLKNAANSLSLTLKNLPIHFNDPNFRADAIKSVGRTTERINQLIHKLSSLRNDYQLQCKPCRLNLLCAEALDSLDSKLLDGSVIHRDLQMVPECDFDRGAIHSVIINLLLNAHESITGHGEIHVSVRSILESVVLTVSDNGIGMTQDFVKNLLFRPFYSTKTKGLGVGMFQCKKIIESHRGGITVASQLNQGTCFTIYFPITPGCQ